LEDYNSGKRPDLSGPSQPTQNVELFGKPTKMLTIIWEQCWHKNPADRPFMSVVRAAFQTKVIPFHQLPEREEVDTSKISFFSDRFDTTSSSFDSSSENQGSSSSLSSSNLKSRANLKSSMKKTASFSSLPTTNVQEEEGEVMNSFKVTRTSSTRSSSLSEKRLGTCI
jgi:hypothetical protein